MTPPTGHSGPECRGPQGGFPSRMPRFAGLLGPAGLVCLALSSPPAARAELVVFEDGRVVKAAGYRVLAEEVEIEPARGRELPG